MTPSAARVEDAARLVDAGRAQEALRRLEPVLAENPEHPEALRVMVHALLVLDRSTEAVDLARRTVRSAPDEPMAHAVLAHALREASGPGPEAEAAAREAVRLAPHDLRCWAALARAATAAADGVAAGQRAVALAPDHADAHNVLGIALLRTDPEAARASFERALALAPGHAIARSNLGLVDLEGRRPAAAAEGFVDALRLSPSLDLARRNLDVALAAMVRQALLAVALLLLVSVLVLGDLSVPPDAAQVPQPGALVGVRVMWFLGLAAAAVLAVRAVVRLSPPLRRYLLRRLRSWNGLTTVWVLLAVAIVVLGTVSLFQPEVTGAETRTGLLRLVVVANIAAWIARRRKR